MNDQTQFTDPYREPKYLLILGTTGAGKTHLAARYAAALRRPFVVIVHDAPDRVYLSHFPPAQVELVSLDPSAYIVRPQLLDTVRQNGKRYLYLSVYDLTEKQIAAMLDSLVASAKESQDLALVIDEAHHFAKVGRAPASLVGFSRGARRYGIDLTWVTQRYVDVDPNIRTNVGYLALFRTPQQIDRERLAAEANTADLNAEALATLPLRAFIFADLRTGYVSPQLRV